MAVVNFRPMAILVALALAACSPPSDPVPATQPTALVALATAQIGAVASTQAVYGAIERNAHSQYRLSAPVEAVVDRIAAPVGSAVERGQEVMALAPSASTRAELARLAAAARAAQAAYERAQRLRADGLVGDAEVESAHAAAQSAQAARAALVELSAQLSLRAPGPGFVQSIAGNPGERLSAGTPLVTISRKGDLRARFGIDPALLPRLARGSGVRLDPGAAGAATVLPIRSVDPSVDPQTRLASIYVTVAAGSSAGAGQPLKGEVTLESSGSAVTVPYAALLDDGGQPYVFVVDQGVAWRREVSLGASDGTMVAITRGVAAGDEVVIEGTTALADGMKVRSR